MPRPLPPGGLKISAALLLVALLCALLSGFGASQTRAADLPLATTSPLTGITFDDRPLMLPVQRNFQMAMLTVGSELGRSCARMEAYGWRVGPSEQARVNHIFTASVDRLRGLGYEVEAQAPASISRDITVFTADRSDRHFILIWSAGEIGLVMTLCETSAPLYGSPPPANTAPLKIAPQPVTIFEVPPPVPHGSPEKFSPIGSWIGNYTCEQGYTGGTLDITSLKGENFQGTFHFYPTPKNPYVPNGRYAVYGQYDAASHRILINPGAWIERPQNYTDTIMIGSFDPVARALSAYFQGISGCTSFEAKFASDIYKETQAAKAKVAPKKKVVKKKPVAKKKPAAPAATAAMPVGTSAPAAAPATAPAVTAPAETPAAAPPAPTAQPGTVPAFVPPSAPAPVGSSAPESPPSIMLPSTAPEPVTTPAPHSDAAPVKPKLIQLAESGQYFVPIVPTAPPPQQTQPPLIARTAGAASGPVTAVPAVNAPLASTAPPPNEAPPPNYVAQPSYVNPPLIAIPASTAPDAQTFIPQPIQAPPPQYVPDPGSPPKP